MKERPIIMTSESVRAILNGTKTQTRRAFTPRQTDNVDADAGPLWTLPSPYGSPGDRLWVREAWSHDAPDLDACRTAHEDAIGAVGYGPYYRATEVAPDTLRWLSPMFMPRWASRLTLEVTEVRVQRLQEISEDDARAEGCRGVRGATGQMVPGPPGTAREAYQDAWNRINGKRRRREYLEIGDPRFRRNRPYCTVIDESASWASNPWVWAITFRRVP